MADLPAIRITAVDEASAVISGVGRTLGGFAAQVVSVGAVIQSLRAALGLGDDIKRMADTTGLAVGALDKLSIVARLNNASLDDMAKSFKFLGGSMIEAQTSSSQSAKLFAALGVAVKDAQGNLRGVDDVMGDTAKALGGIENETVRAAAGTAVFGKSYLQIAASLRNYTKDQEAANDLLKRYGGVSIEAANLSDEFGDKLTLLGEGSKRALLGGLVPGISAAGAGLDELAKGGGEFQRSFGEVVGWVTQWGIKAFIGLKTVFEEVGTVWAAIFASISQRSLDPMRELPADLERIALAGADSMSRIDAAYADAGRASIKAAASQDRMNRAQVDAAAIANILAPAQKEVADGYEALVRSLEQTIEKQQELTELEKIERAISAGTFAKRAEYDKARLRDLALTVDESNKLTAATKKAIEADKEGFEWIMKVKDAYLKMQESAKRMVDDLQFEVQALTMTNEQREIAIKLRELERLGVVKGSGDWEAYAAQIRDAVESKAALQSQIDLWKSIDDAAHDAFTHIFEGGRSVFKRLADSLKSTLLELLYQMTIKRWIIQIGTEVTSNAGLVSALGGGSSLFGSAAGSAAGGFLSAGGGFETGMLGTGINALLGEGAAGAFAGGMASPIGTMTTLLGGEGGAAIGAGMGLEAGLGAMVPIAGVAVVAGMLIKNYLDKKKGGPKESSYGTSGADYSAFGGFAEANANMQGVKQSGELAKLAKDTQTAYNETLKLLGGSGAAEFLTYISSDPKGTAATMLTQRANVGGQDVYSINTGEGAGNLGRDPQVLADRTALEIKRSVFAALQASALPKQVAELFGKFTANTMSGAEIDNLLGLATAFQNLSSVLANNAMTDALDALKSQSELATEAFRQQGETLAEMARVFDGSAAASSNLTSATNGYYNSLVGMLAMMETAKKTIDDMFSSSIKDYTMAGLDKQGQYDYLRRDSQSMFEQLQKTTDIDTIKRLSEQINSEQRQAFGLLSPEEQKQIWQSYVDDATKVNEEAQKRIDSAEENTRASFEGFMAGVKAAVDGAADKITAAAAVISDAGAKMSSAADGIPSTMTLVDTGGSEIGGGGGG